jgi:hypothetical protein
VFELAMTAPGTKSRPTSVDLETRTDARSPQTSRDELETIRAELRELHKARERDAETLQELLRCVKDLTK